MINQSEHQNRREYYKYYRIRRFLLCTLLLLLVSALYFDVDIKNSLWMQSAFGFSFSYLMYCLGFASGWEAKEEPDTKIKNLQKEGFDNLSLSGKFADKKIVYWNELEMDLTRLGISPESRILFKNGFFGKGGISNHNEEWYKIECDLVRLGLNNEARTKIKNRFIAVGEINIKYFVEYLILEIRHYQLKQYKIAPRPIYTPKVGYSEDTYDKWRDYK